MAKEPKVKEIAKELVQALPNDAEARRTRLKNLIVLGKERGFLTYAEINDHLPDDMLDAEQIENIISMINDMGIQVYDEAPDTEALLMSDSTPAAPDEDAVEEAEAAVSTLDSEFGRTTDPVRMYMREMGSVELLTREGEIEIAKRIEDGLRHMIQAISACPTTIAEILQLGEKVSARRDARRRGGGRSARSQCRGDHRRRDRGRDHRGRARCGGGRGRGWRRCRGAERQPAAAQAGCARALRHRRPALRQDDQGAGQAWSARQALHQGAGGHLRASS